MRESEIIARHFKFPASNSVLCGVGDDAAILRPPPGEDIAVSTDSLVEGVHFFSDIDPYLLARKAAAVSLSDMAAMGAKPLWMLVALTAPHGEEWLERFAEGMKSSAAQHDYAMVGGDLSRAALVSVTSTALGAVSGATVLRSGACAGDDIWISGATGAAALAVHCRKRGEAPPPAAASKLDDPMPRLDVGADLASFASAAADISDGIVAAAAAIAGASGVRVNLRREDMPVPDVVQDAPVSSDLKREFVERGGDDYELLFSAPTEMHERLSKRGMFCIGSAEAGEGVYVSSEKAEAGYEHNFG